MLVANIMRKLRAEDSQCNLDSIYAAVANKKGLDAQVWESKVSIADSLADDCIDILKKHVPSTDINNEVLQRLKDLEEKIKTHSRNCAQRRPGDKPTKNQPTPQWLSRTISRFPPGDNT